MSISEFCLSCTCNLMDRKLISSCDIQSVILEMFFYANKCKHFRFQDFISEDLWPYVTVNLDRTSRCFIPPLHHIY